METNPASESEKTSKAYETIEQYMVPLSKIITFSPDQPIQEVISTIIEKKIAGGPVLDEHGNIVGMISEKDCLHLIVDQAYYNMPPQIQKVSDYMSPHVETLSPDTKVLDAAKTFLNSPIRRFPIVKDGKLIGQVSRRHILKVTQEMRGA